MDHLLLHLLLLLPPPVPCTSPLSLFWRLKGTAPWSDRSAIITTLYASSSFSWSDRTLFPPDLAAFARETSCLFSPFFRPPPHWSPLGSISLSISLSPVSSFPFHTSTPLCSSLPTRLISHLSSLFLPCSCKLGWVPQLDLPLLQSRIVVVIISGEKLLYDPNIGVLPWVSSVPSLHQMHCIHLRKRRCPCSRSTTTSSCNLALLLLMVVVVDWWAPWRLRFRYLSRWSDPECSVGKWLPFASLHVWRTFFFLFFFALTVVSVRERTSHGFWGEKFAIIIWPCPKLSLREHWIRARIARPKRSGKIGRHALGTAHIMLGRLYQLPPHMHASTSNFSNASD